MNEARETPAALSAFLRGVERRGALFAQLQSGDPEVGDVALSAAMRAFRNHAAALPMAEWPRRFWTLLVASPPLRQDAAVARWPVALQRLGSLDPAVRAALLTRLAAGLAEEDAVAVLGLDQAAYRQALASACPQRPNGQPDPEGWRQLAEAVQQALRDLQPDRLARLARLRESAIAGTRVQRPLTPAFAPRLPARARQRQRWPWALLVVALCAAALVATYLWPQLPAWFPGSAGRPTGAEASVLDPVPVAVETLPSSPPAARYDADFARLSHPDFDLLLDPEEEAIAQQADFYAWYAAGGPAEPSAAAAAENTVPESADAEF